MTTILPAVFVISSFELALAFRVPTPSTDTQGEAIARLGRGARVAIRPLPSQRFFAYAPRADAQREKFPATCRAASVPPQPELFRCYALAPCEYARACRQRLRHHARNTRHFPAPAG